MRRTLTAMVTTGLALAFALALAVPGAAHFWGGYQKDECSGEAPLIAVCTTGAHFRFHDDGTFRHGFTGLVGPDYTGTLESALVYVGGERLFRCDFEAGEIVAGSCIGAGAFPPVQSYFVQLCRSYEAGTTDLGGTGAWGCFMEHGS